MQLREVKDPGKNWTPTEFDPPSQRSLTLTKTGPLVGTFKYVPDFEGKEDAWTGTFKLDDCEMTTWIELKVDDGGKTWNDEDSKGKTFKTMIQINDWFENLENYEQRTKDDD